MVDKEIVEKALKAIKRRADYEYFFSKIDNPDWIVPLRESGMFLDPPAVETEGNYLRHPSWPESKYLLRVAAKAPGIVTETVLLVPETDNERVHEDFIHSALSMPADHTVKIAKSETKWIKAQEHFYFNYPLYVGKLASYLAKSGKIRVSSELAMAILAISRSESESGSPDDEWYSKSIEVVAKFSTWEYEKVLKKCVPDLVETGGMNVFEMLCELLDTALSYRTDHSDPPDDHSWMWRRTIQEHEQNVSGHDDIRSFLIDAIRDAALQLMNLDESILSELVTYLESREWLIFKRISIYVLSQFVRLRPELVAERLISKDLFEDKGFRYEYSQLASTGFSDLSPDQKKTILTWIDDGPNLDEYRARFLGSTGREATSEEIQRRTKIWQRDRLDQFSNSLPQDWQQRFEELLQEFGKTEHPEFSFYSTSWVGPTSPLSDEDLKKMSVDTIVEYLKEWSHPEGQMVPSPEGLSRTLSAVVSAEPMRFVIEANLFKDLDPTYVRGLLDGLREIPKSDAVLSWEPILDLCQWVVNQPRAIPGRNTEYSDLDPGWVWTRKSIAKLLSDGLKDVPGEIPIEFRQRVWDVILPLTDDLDPGDEEYGVGHMDPPTLSINSVRGEAMHTVVFFGQWVQRHADEGKDNSFELMPEVREVLDKHLDTKMDASLAIRSVYGQWFPWLNLMDSTWTDQAKGKIFSLDSSSHWDAAWKTYVTFCQPYDDVLEVLRGQYAQAVEMVGQSSAIEVEMADAEERLSDHLMLYFCRGKLQLEDPLIQTFYDRATSALKTHTINFIGHTLRAYRSEILADLQERLKDLWKWRYQQAIQNQELDELTQFCWWISSGKLDAGWALDQWKAVLNLNVKIDNLDFAAEELVKMVSEKPVQVLECLNLMVNHLDKKGVYFSWEDEAKQILGEALKIGNDAAVSQATDIIHQLGALGHFEFRSLL